MRDHCYLQNVSCINKPFLFVIESSINVEKSFLQRKKTKFVVGVSLNLFLLEHYRPGNVPHSETFELPTYVMVSICRNHSTELYAERGN